MIPGYLARLYPDYQETLIDLQHLCSSRNKHDNIRFLKDGVLDIDIQKQLVHLMEDPNPLPYDMISLDIGSASKSLDDVPGAFDYTIPTRPIHDMVKLLEQAEQCFTQKKDDKIKLVVVGGGASGIELALSLASRWELILGERLHITLVTSDHIVLPEVPAARSIVKELLLKKGITMVFNATVVEAQEHFLILCSGMKVPYNYCVWATGAGCHDLARTLQSRGLDVIQKGGWIKVQDTLQSTTHSNIFAAGDCCVLSSTGALPKAGVYALQEGPTLALNLERYVMKEPLESFHAKAKGCLHFLSCGDGTALGFVFGIPLRGKWVWEIKKAMDKDFLSMFDDSGNDVNAPTANFQGNIEDSSVLLPPQQAAELLCQIDVANYRHAWRILEWMTSDDNYRVKVLKHYVRKSEGEYSNEEDGGRNSEYKVLPGAQAAI